MAKKSRKKTKKAEKKNTRPVVLEFEGFSAGEDVWAIYLNRSIIKGTICEFHPIDKLGPAVTLLTVNKGYRTVLVSTLSRKVLKKSDITGLKK